MRRNLLLGVASLAGLLAPAAARADGIEVVTVTAERREESVQKAPVAITALSADELERTNAQSLEDVSKLAPNLAFNRTSNFVQLTVRGIGLSQYNLGGEPGVAVYVDGVYLARPFALDSAFNDLARVEVLRGPQGTLYGRNATGGAINLISNAPSDTLEGHIGVTAGNYGRVQFDGVLSGPLDDSGDIRGRISVIADRHDGYTENLANGDHVQDFGEMSGRAQIAADLAPKVTLTLAADFTNENDSGPIFKPGTISPFPLPGAPAGTVLPMGFAPAFGGRVSPDPWKIYLNGPQDYRFQGSGASAKLVWEMDGATLTALTAYRNTRFHLLGDLDGTDASVPQGILNEDLRESADAISGEIQLASNRPGPFQWIFGGFAYREDGFLNYLFDIGLFGTDLHDLAAQRTTSYAIFGEGNYNFTDALKLTVGLRYSDDDKSLNESSEIFGGTGFNKTGKSWGALTPKFVLSYDVDDDKMLYVSATRGFKSGGFNIGALQHTPYNPEYVWSYEAGFKSQWDDGHLLANVDVFHYDYSNLQVTQYAVGKTNITNAASATANGVEGEFTAIPVEHLTLNATVAYLDASFDDFQETDSFRPLLGVLDLHGNSLPRAPHWQTDLGAQYDFQLGDGDVLSARYDFSYWGKEYFTEFNTGYASAPAYSLSNARLAYQTGDGRWQVALYGKNLFNKAVLTNVTVSAVNGGTLISYGDPRTFGVQVKYNFE
ncbi:MAG TPA: TonB-dependent receptor [Rhizomicrobium sp.]|jgi:iron complex outermembrane receptor protein